MLTHLVAVSGLSCLSGCLLWLRLVLRGWLSGCLVTLLLILLFLGLQCCKERNMK
jgi:hypothetical protein